MISVDELLYEFELRLNSLDRQDNQNIPTENKLILLNNAQISWIKSKLGQNNIYKIGYEGFRKRIDDLQVLKVNDRKLTVGKSSNERHISYYGDLNIDDYMFYVSSYVKATSDDCSDTLGVNLIKEGELETLYNNDNYKPSYIWRETIATIGDNKLYVYTDDTFVIDDIRLTYLRLPARIDKTGYIHIDGTASVDQDCELPEYAKNDIVDLAVKYAAQATDNPFQMQMAKEREQNNE